MENRIRTQQQFNARPYNTVRNQLLSFAFFLLKIPVK